MNRIDWYEVRTRYLPAALGFLKRYGVVIGVAAVVLIVVGLVYVSLPPKRVAPRIVPEQPPTGFTLTSNIMRPGDRIPKRYTEDGANVSPPFDILNIPPGTEELALICEDPDAPTPTPWVHWVLYRIPPTTTGLPEEIPRTEELTNPIGALQGTNSWGEIGYRGPAPPPGSGTHRYRFVVFALSKGVGKRARAGLSRDDLMNLIGGNVIESAEFVATYSR